MKANALPTAPHSPPQPPQLPSAPLSPSQLPWAPRLSPPRHPQLFPSIVSPQPWSTRSVTYLALLGLVIRGSGLPFLWIVCDKNWSPFLDSDVWSPIFPTQKRPFLVITVQCTCMMHTTYHQFKSYLSGSRRVLGSPLTYTTGSCLYKYLRSSFNNEYYCWFQPNGFTFSFSFWLESINFISLTK